MTSVRQLDRTNEDGPENDAVLDATQPTSFSSSDVAVRPPSGESAAPSQIAPSFSSSDVVVRPWPDPYIDTAGHDPRSAYVETYWLPTLGPSATWFLRRVAGCLEREPGGFAFDAAEWAHWLGVGSVRMGRGGALERILRRCLQFGAARVPHAQGSWHSGLPAVVEVRRKLPTLSATQASHLPEDLRESHRRAIDSGQVKPVIEIIRQRSRSLALNLVRLGEDRASVERCLVRWRFHPAMARESTAWACAQLGADPRP